MWKTLKATVKEATFQLDPEQSTSLNVRQIEEQVNAAVARGQGYASPMKENVVTINPQRITAHRYRSNLPAWLDMDGRSQQSEGVFVSSIEVNLVELHCPKADNATAKLSQVNSKTFDSSVEVKLAVITGGITGSLTLEIKESYTATNECVRMAVHLPTLVQTVRVSEGTREPYFVTRILEVFEGDADVEVQLIETCECRTGKTAQDLGDREYQNMCIKGAGSIEHIESIQITDTVKLGVKVPFGPLDEKGKPLHELIAGISFKNTHQLIFTYTLPGRATYPYVNTHGNRGLIWLKPMPVCV